MKRKVNLFILLISCLMLGWTLGYLRLPYIEKNISFWAGFLASLGFILFIITLVVFWNKHVLLLRLIGKDQTKNNAKTTIKTYTLLGGLALIFIFLGISGTGYIIYQQNKLLEAQIEDQDKIIQEQTELVESVRKSNLVFMIDHFLEKVETELNDTPNGTISDVFVSRIARLSDSFHPYRYFKEGHLAEKKLSPERGQLLQDLSLIKMDSSSFAKIKFKTTFSEADLSGADLKALDLSGIDLRGANLKDSNLSGTNLKGADLRGANLWGANLNQANLSDADMKRADLRWAKLNAAYLVSTNLDGADLTSAQLIKADLREASFQWANLAGAVLKEANLVRADFFGAGLKETNLTNTNLTEASLRQTHLDRAILQGAELKSVELIDKDWFQKLDEWQVIGAKEIQQRYGIVDIVTRVHKFTKYRLEKNKD